MSILAVEHSSALPVIKIEIPVHLSPQACQTAELLKRRAGLALLHSEVYYTLAKDGNLIVNPFSPIARGWSALGSAAYNFYIAIRHFLPEFFENPHQAVNFTKTIYDHANYVPKTLWGQNVWGLLDKKQQNHFRDLIRRIEFAAFHSDDYINAAKECSASIERPEKVKLIQELNTLANTSERFAIEGKNLIRVLFEDLEINVSNLKNQKIILPMLALFTFGAWVYKRHGSPTKPTEA